MLENQEIEGGRWAVPKVYNNVFFFMKFDWEGGDSVDQIHLKTLSFFQFSPATIELILYTELLSIVLTLYP